MKPITVWWYGKYQLREIENIDNDTSQITHVIVVSCRQHTTLTEPPRRGKLHGRGIFFTQNKFAK